MNNPLNRNWTCRLSHLRMPIFFTINHHSRELQRFIGRESVTFHSREVEIWITIVGQIEFRDVSFPGCAAGGVDGEAPPLELVMDAFLTRAKHFQF